MRALTKLLSVPFLLHLAGAATGQQPSAPPRPRDATLATRADEAALARLEAPGRVLFEDGFEGEESLAKYFEIRGAREGHAALDASEGAAHTGHGAIRFVAPARDGRESGAGASGWLGAQGHERIHYRRYIRFADDYDQGNLNHTGGGLAGVAGDGRWDGMGKAGVKPSGDDRFTCGFEPWRDWGRAAAPGYLFLYTYWVDMLPGRDGKWWGNMLEPPPDRRVVPPRGEWVCLEQMIRVNDVGEANGELAAWVDGELYLHFTGLRWRTDERVLVKRFDLGIYVHEARRENVVWYDDVIVSTGYVGPSVPQPDEAGGPEDDGAR